MSSTFLSGEAFVMIDDFLIDVSLSEEHEFEADVTEFPVESGANISDNIRSKPLRVTMEGLVSSTPLPAITSKRPIRKSNEGTSSPEEFSVVNPAADAYSILLAIRDQREPVTIRTSLGTYEQMALESLSIPRDKSTGDALKFTARFRQIRTVVNKRSLKRVAVPNGRGKANKGSKFSKVWQSLFGVPVVSFPQNQRNVPSLQPLGKPILSTKEGVPSGQLGIHENASGIRRADGRGALDHYALNTKELKAQWQPDGYIKDNVYRGIGAEYDTGKRLWAYGEAGLYSNKTPPGVDPWASATKKSGQTDNPEAVEQKKPNAVEQRQINGTSRFL